MCEMWVYEAVGLMPCSYEMEKTLRRKVRCCPFLNSFINSINSIANNQFHFICKCYIILEKPFYTGMTCRSPKQLSLRKVVYNMNQLDSFWLTVDPLIYN